MTQFCSFLWLSNIALYIWTIFFIHSSVDGQLGCFHVLAIVSSNAMNTEVCVCVCVPFSITFSQGILPVVALLGHMVVLGFPGDSVVKKLPACRRHRKCRLDPWVGKIPWRREWQRTPGIVPGELHGQRSLVRRH